MSETALAPNHQVSIIRSLVGDYFLGDCKNGVIIELETNTGSQYRLELQPGRVAGVQADGALYYHARVGSVFRNGKRVSGVHYAGFSTPTATITALDADRRVILASSSIARLFRIETV